MQNKKCQMFGCQIDALTMNETVSLVSKAITEKKNVQHVVVNVAKLVAMQSDEDLKSIVNSCDIVNADGMPIVWASKILDCPLPCRVAGIDLFQELVKVSAEKGFRPFFFGAREPVVTEVVKIFKQKYPKLEVAGVRNGYFSADEEPQIARMIRDSKADIVFVAFSSPKKEEFLNKWMPVMRVPFCMGVGGSFDVIAGVTQRAPQWMQKTGMEWFYRFLQEPARMWKRYSRSNPLFVWMVIKAFWRKLRNAQL